MAEGDILLFAVLVFLTVLTEGAVNHLCNDGFAAFLCESAAQTSVDIGNFKSLYAVVGNFCDQSFFSFSQSEKLSM